LSDVKIVEWVLLSSCGLLVSCGMQSIMMPNDGMNPTIGVGDQVSGNFQTFEKKDPELGDVVIFRPFGHPGRRWVLRVAGVPGDRIGYSGGALRRNGQLVVSPGFQDGRTYPPVRSGGPQIGTLRLGEYFLLSDDPAFINDSRAWGPVRRTQILGKVTSHR